MSFTIRSPVTIGTIWAIEKAFFTEIGELDDGMEFWGGENIDLALRVRCKPQDKILNYTVQSLK